MHEKTKQGIEGNNNVQQSLQADVINNITNILDVSQSDNGILDEIFEYVRLNIKSQVLIDKSKPEKLLKAQKKINRNFRTALEKKEVETLYMLALEKASLIEKKFSEIDSHEQKDLHSFMYGQYSKNRSALLSPMDNLQQLFTFVTPKSKEKNPQYVHCAKALVLFFFGDCTIFEKTRDEQKQYKLELNGPTN